jgi:hypothetical protein
MPVPKKFDEIWGPADAGLLFAQCVEKAEELNIESPGKYDPHSF